ncbi:hypothetical protein Oscil6304_0852 [Oscillatoria acuminata PCC 6304]|uniref:Uncharacterized protein n=1 Tax=Oscillatoria acuminata PCC 6304 TaxID=56110 RepID=K9TDH1_9CYAN|nr:hypothetical protein Oscil6304_0852 [Oscillatoria acuminata PCC 6304]
MPGMESRESGHLSFQPSLRNEQIISDLPNRSNITYSSIGLISMDILDFPVKFRRNSGSLSFRSLSGHQGKE